MNISSMHPWINDDDADSSSKEFELMERERDRRPITEKADPLALSWVAYGVWKKDPKKRWIEWRDLEVHEHDREMARVTREYYRNRLAMRALRNTREPTEFERDLYEICNGGIMRVCHMGMLYRLPYFYVEDTETEALRDRFDDGPRDTDVIPAFLQERSTRVLAPDARIFHSRKRREVMQYWFRDVNTGHPVAWNVMYDNPLRSMVDHLHRTQPTVSLEARWHVVSLMDNSFHYWIPADVELRIP
jgi:hypothetical protein